MLGYSGYAQSFAREIQQYDGVFRRSYLERKIRIARTLDELELSLDHRERLIKLLANLIEVEAILTGLHMGALRLTLVFITIVDLLGIPPLIVWLARHGFPPTLLNLILLGLGNVAIFAALHTILFRVGRQVVTPVRRELQRHWQLIVGQFDNLDQLSGALELIIKHDQTVGNVVKLLR